MTFPVPATPGAPARDRVAALDLLRFIAAAAVMLYHFTYHYSDGSGAAPSTLELVTRYGYLGVDVFFMISGFVVLWSARGRPAFRFMRARILRLYPEFWIAVLVSATVFTLVPGGFDLDGGVRTLLLNLVMVPGYLGAQFVDGVYWTLAIEIKFYVILWVLILARQLDRIELWLYVWLAVSVAETFVEVGGAIRSLTIFPYGALFASGGLFFLVFDSGWTPARAAGLTVGLALSANHGVARMSDFVDAMHITPEAQMVAVLIIASAFALFALLSRIDLPAKAHEIAALGGALTYPLYLLHNTGKELFINGPIPGPTWVRVILAICWSLLIAWIVMWTSSRTMQPVLRRFIDAFLPARLWRI